MLTPAPLPTWLDLCRAMVRPAPSDFELARPWHRRGETAGWLSRSAWSLALIALWRKSRAPASPATVWIPDYFCNASLVPLRKTGVRLVFYPVTEGLLPDIAACRALADTGSPDIFVLVHYFGRSTPAAPVRDFCNHHGAWLIEDAAHVLRPVNGIGEYGDFVLYSPHKHLPLPDGAVLAIRPNGPGKFGEAGLASFGSASTWPGQLGELQKELGCAASSGEIHAAMWLLKRVLQKLGVRSWRRSISSFVEPSKPCHTVVPALAAPSQSGLSRRLLGGLLFGLESVARQRQRHQILWDALLPNDGAAPQDIVSAAERAANRQWTPYLASYRLRPAQAEATHDQWQRQGLPVTTWPDLPPEVISHQERHANAWHLRHSRLYLPVHQSLTARGLLNRCLRPQAIPESEPHLRLVWNKATREQWGRWMVQASRSNLLQSWDYGEAKADQEGWRVRRGAFYRDDEPIAFAQVLQKGVPGLLTVSRINRGPLSIRPLTAHEQRDIFGQLANLGCLRRGRVLTIAPELDLSGSSMVMMGNMGFRQSSPCAYESLWIDLDCDLNALRKLLDGKWRNMLAFSEKAGLTLEIGGDEARFEWMIARYRELMEAKDFSGPPVDLLRSLRRQLGAKDRMPVLRAMHDGEPVAGVCLARHGAAATYLLGWNGARGRNLKANQYLLWQAIAYLKQSGLRWFDLGGISEEQTPGISAFKLGVNGERYESLGEYWRW